MIHYDTPGPASNFGWLKTDNALKRAFERAPVSCASCAAVIATMRAIASVPAFFYGAATVYSCRVRGKADRRTDADLRVLI